MQITPINNNRQSFKSNVITKGLHNLPINRQEEVLRAIPRIKDLGDETTNILLVGKRTFFFDNPMLKVKVSHTLRNLMQEACFGKTEKINLTCNASDSFYASAHRDLSPYDKALSVYENAQNMFMSAITQDKLIRETQGLVSREIELAQEAADRVDRRGGAFQRK